MTTKDELRRAMEAIDLSDGDVVTGPRTVSIVFSFRAPAEWSDEIAAETERRGLENPSQLLKALVREGLDRTASAEGQVVTVRLDDLHRAIDRVARRRVA